MPTARQQGWHSIANCAKRWTRIATCPDVWIAENCSDIVTTPIINYTELRFTSETEMNRYLDQGEAIWTEEVIALL